MCLLVGGASSIAIPLAKWSWAGTLAVRHPQTVTRPPTPHTQTLTLLISVRPWKGTEWNCEGTHPAAKSFWESLLLKRALSSDRQMWGFWRINAETQYVLSLSLLSWTTFAPEIFSYLVTFNLLTEGLRYWSRLLRSRIFCGCGLCIVEWCF